MFVAITADLRYDVWNHTADALLIVDTDGVIVEANDQAQYFLRVDEPVGRSVDSLVPEGGVIDHASLRAGFAANPQRRAMGTGSRLHVLRGDGTVAPVHIALSPLPDGMVLAAIRDLSDLAVAESRLVEATRRRILAEDHERIARDLHDRIIQSLFALGMDLEAGLAAPDTDHASRISDAVDTLDDIIRDIRDVIFDVRRNRPDDASLRGQVIAVVASLIPSLGFEPAIEFHGDFDDCSDELADHVLAVILESLTNVARHAEATTADVDVSVEDGTLVARVIDDGLGLPAELDRHSGHRNLTDRARLALGEFRVATRDEGGTIVEWRAPYRAG